MPIYSDHLEHITRLEQNLSDTEQKLKQLAQKKADIEAAVTTLQQTIKELPSKSEVDALQTSAKETTESSEQLTTLNKELEEKKQALETEKQTEATFLNASKMAQQELSYAHRAAVITHNITSIDQLTSVERLASVTREAKPVKESAWSLQSPAKQKQVRFDAFMEASSVLSPHMKIEELEKLAEDCDTLLQSNREEVQLLKAINKDLNSSFMDKNPHFLSENFWEKNRVTLGRLDPKKCTQATEAISTRIQHLENNIARLDKIQTRLRGTDDPKVTHEVKKQGYIAAVKEAQTSGKRLALHDVTEVYGMIRTGGGGAAAAAAPVAPVASAGSLTGAKNVDHHGNNIPVFRAPIAAGTPDTVKFSIPGGGTDPTHGTPIPAACEFNIQTDKLAHGPQVSVADTQLEKVTDPAAREVANRIVAMNMIADYYSKCDPKELPSKENPMMVSGKDPELKKAMYLTLLEMGLPKEHIRAPGVEKPGMFKSPKKLSDFPELAPMAKQLKTIVESSRQEPSQKIKTMLESVRKTSESIQDAKTAAKEKVDAFRSPPPTSI
ncbi:MAG: hypothetical protein Q8R79_06665 [Legionellaceae bacterium]|nr:hypothetical protein [Legionellaceae bacterium]